MIHRLIALFIINALSIHSINAHSFQAKHMPLDNQDHFIASLQQELRSPQYKKEVLPNDFSYLSQLITFGTKNNQPPAYVRSLFKMFSNMLKSAHYVNAYAFSQELEDLSTILDSYFGFPVSKRYITNSALYDASFTDRFIATVNSALYAKFSTEYESFRQNPDLFLRNMSADILSIAQEEIEQSQIRQSIIRFCEIALNKLIWHPGEQEKTWELTKKIATQLATLLEHNIIDDSNDLDDLYWTLLNRYCYFMEVAALDMPESFYTALKNDIRSNKIVLFELPEQDFIVEPKLSYMQRSIMESEVRAYGFQHGLLRG
jgi:hypothetical protein